VDRLPLHPKNLADGFFCFLVWVQIHFLHTGYLSIEEKLDHRTSRINSKIILAVVTYHNVCVSTVSLDTTAITLAPIDAMTPHTWLSVLFSGAYPMLVRVFDNWCEFRAFYLDSEGFCATTLPYRCRSSRGWSTLSA
jgi:hypothetical protein